MKKKDSDSSQDEGEADENEVYTRQDLYVVFTHERELRNVDQVRIKISQFTGVVMRLKTITVQAMENLLAAIEADALVYQSQQQASAMPLKPKVISQPEEMGGLTEQTPVATQTPTSGIINLRFEECVFTSRSVILLKNFLYQKQLIETFHIQRVEFQEPIIDFRNLMEGVQFSIKIRKVGVLGMLFDEEPYGKIISHLLNDCRQLKEFDASNCEFFHPKCFFEMCQSLINEKSRILILKLKGVHISNLEGKVLQFVLMKNKTLHTLDLSNCKVDSGECLEFFLQKLDKYSTIKYLIMDSIQPDLSNSIEILGEALSENTKIEVLIMRENKLKWFPYSSFWDNIKGNSSLQKINVSKTDLSDRVLEKMCAYLLNPELKLVDLDLSRNQITDVGLQNLSEALLQQNQIKYLNLSQNVIRDSGIRHLVVYLSQSSCSLIELSLMGNKINNDGIIYMAEFIKPNQNLKMLDISKNLYGDVAFQSFASEMGEHSTLTFLDISKSKELNDEGSLVTLAQQLQYNTHLQTLDLTNVKVRKPFLKNHLEPSLQKNITLKYVLGKLTPDIIDEQLSINIQIRTDVEPNYQEAPKIYRHPNPHIQQHNFDCKNFDPECQSMLNMKNQNSTLFDAAFKFMCQKDIRQLDLTDMDIQDGQLYQLGPYLQQIPNLRSLILNGNSQITDDGIIRIAHALQKNNKLAHLSILNCPNLTDDCMSEIYRVLSNYNMMMCMIEFDAEQYSTSLGQKVKRETVLNRAIQEQLKPSFYSKQLQRQPSLDSNKSHPDSRQDFDNKHSEIAFVEEAPVHKYLGSAIKCWRITKPTQIQIENQQLTDKHVNELCEFLKDRNMLTSLNLRRNFITNEGATQIIDWMMNHDKTLTHLDVSRNRVTRKGAEQFLEALQRITRIQDFQISYGNPIPLDIGLAIGNEVLANNQIKSNQEEFSRNANNQNLVNPKVTLTKSKYELIDRGPNYMRCAIKSVELLRIQHLSLPDNMLGIEEAKMLAGMIRVNSPLRTLNLELNNLDAQCGRLLASALKMNDNLQLLNISKNKLSDLGVNYLLQSLITSRLKAIEREKEIKTLQPPVVLNSEQLPDQSSIQEATQTIKPLTQDSQMLNVGQISLKQRGAQLSPKRPGQQLQITTNNTNEDQNVSQRSQVSQMLQTEDIEMCERGQLKVLNILDNQTTIESYKVISTMLEINKKVAIYFDDPRTLYDQQSKLEQNGQLLISPHVSSKVEPSPAADPADLAQPSVTDFENPQTTSMNLVGADEANSQSFNENNSDSQAEKKKKQKKQVSCLQMIKECNSSMYQSMTSFSAIICCYRRKLICFKKDELRGTKDKPSLGIACCWHFFTFKQRVTQFIPMVDSKISFNKKHIQNVIVGSMLVNQALLYIFTILAFFMPIRLILVTDLILFAFFGYLWAYENIMLLVLRGFVKVNICNPYLCFEVLMALLNKLSLCCLGLLGGICFQTKTEVSLAVGILSIVAVAFDQYKTIQRCIQCIKEKQEETDSIMLEFLERSQRVIEVLNYRGILIAWQKITLMPTKHSELLSLKIAQELNPDLIKALPKGCNKLVENIKDSYKNDFLVRHLWLIDIPLLIVLIVGMTVQWLQVSPGVLVSIVILCLDACSTIYQIKSRSEVTNEVSIDSDMVYNLGNERNQKISSRYTEVLMRERELQAMHENGNESHDVEDVDMRSERSLFDTKGSVERLDQQVNNLEVEKRMLMNSSPNPDGTHNIDISVQSLNKRNMQNPSLQLTQEMDDAPIETIKLTNE